jgi:uncharacterized protein (DUF1330 family)
MALYGGGYQSVLRHRVTTLEGDWRPLKGVTILEFPSYEQALAWYHSPEYAPLRELRMATGRFDVILVDGISEDDPATTGKLDTWEIERIAELEAEEAQAAQEQRREAPNTSLHPAVDVGRADPPHPPQPQVMRVLNRICNTLVAIGLAVDRSTWGLRHSGAGNSR